MAPLSSLVRGEQYQSLEVQVLADGLFHVTIYLIAIAGLLMLWRQGSGRPADRILLGWAVLGFSIWQFVDVVLVHWLIGIHRVRVGVPNPLLWDVGWLVAFGITSVSAGIWLLFRSDPGEGMHGRRATALISAVVIVGAGLFRQTEDRQPWCSSGRSETFAAAAALDAGILWSDSTGRLLVLDVPPTTNTWRLYTQGALLVGNTGFVGCINATRV